MCSLRARLARVPAEALVLSPIVLGELEVPVAKSTARECNAALLAAIISEIELVAQAGALGAVVVTDNEAEFTRLPDLSMQNWSRP